jgi:hypothetical protein
MMLRGSVTRACAGPGYVPRAWPGAWPTVLSRCALFCDLLTANTLVMNS